jgi:hypothetical protein
MSKTVEENVEELMKRAEANDAGAMLRYSYWIVFINVDC